MSSEDILIWAQNLGKCYQLYEKPHHRLLQTLFHGRRQFYREFWALRGVSLELKRGESLGVLGRNGAGKSTLLQLLSGVLAPTEGTLEVRGRVAALLELGSGFNPEFTGRENAYLNGSILGLSKAEMDAAMPAIERFADIGDFFDQPVKLYSSGMMVRVAFAVQVQVKPDILIVDEALAVGDALFQRRCYQRMNELIAAGTSLLFVSHDTEAVNIFTQKAILLERGRCVESGLSKNVSLAYQAMLAREYDEYARETAEQINAAAKKDMKQCATSFDLSVVDLEKIVIHDGSLNHKMDFYSGEPIAFDMYVTPLQDVENLFFCIRIVNKQGVKMYSWGTWNQDLEEGVKGEDGLFVKKRFEKGKTYILRFLCEACNLGPNLYEVQAGISEVASLQQGGGRDFVWKHELGFFTVRQKRTHVFGGVCDMRMRVWEAHDTAESSGSAGVGEPESGKCALEQGAHPDLATP